MKALRTFSEAYNCFSSCYVENHGFKFQEILLTLLQLFYYYIHRNFISIGRLQVEIQELTKERSRYQKKLERNSVYQKYMEKVQESSDEFSEIREIIARYDTLVATHLV